MLLPSYTQTAREIGTLRLPTLEIPGLFMAKKLDPRPLLKKPHANSEPVPTHNDIQTPLPSSSSQRKRSNSQSKAAKKKNKPQTPPINDHGILGMNSAVRQIHNDKVLVEEDEEDDSECNGHLSSDRTLSPCLEEYQLPCMYQHMSDLGCQSMVGRLASNIP